MFDENALSGPDPIANGEARWIAIARDPTDRLLVIVYTWRGERVRIISGRSSARNSIGCKTARMRARQATRILAPLVSCPDGRHCDQKP